jgi:hypothetical protein
VTLAIVASAKRGLTFPGSVRWGYANCATCHYNVAGGGVLTPYGRQLSRELLSTWGSEREAEFAYGSRLPKWLALGGDIEYLATSSGSGQGMRLVQADLEAAVSHGPWLAVATAGRGDHPSDPMGRDWISRRHYVQYAATPTLSLRAGRFLPNYGVWNGDGTIAVRRGLGWTDSDNVEANWITDRVNVAVTGILDGSGASEGERGVSASAGVFFGGKRKVWLSVLSRGRPGEHRRAGGVSGVFGIGRKAYLLTQADLQQVRRDLVAPARTRDLLVNACFARETVKGLYVLLVDEMARRDLGQPGRLSHSYGAGLRWFPRPHIELQLRWRKQDRDAVSPEYLDAVSGFVHFYP